MIPQAAFDERFEKNCGPGELIFEQGQPGQEMFAVLAGEVVISKMSQGDERVVSLLEKGDMFGEMGLAGLTSRSATARAGTAGARVVVIDQPRFVYLVSQQPGFALAVMAVLSARIRVLESRCGFDP